MTITLGWLRRQGQTVELLVASDSRLRSIGAMDQAPKIFRLDRGDSCLALRGDTQFAYPLFYQIGVALNNHIKTRTRALDVTDVKDLILKIADSIIGSWDAKPADKLQELKDTQILFAGWSAVHNRFELSFLTYSNTGLVFHRKKMRIGHPWHETTKSLVFLGDYEDAYRLELCNLLARRHTHSVAQDQKIKFDFNYEPIEALNMLLNKPDPTHERRAIGGAPQLIKIYRFSNSLPFAVRLGPERHYLYGRRLFAWEKTEFPIIDLSSDPAKVVYPMEGIPLPKDV